jgi:hypothetical protein
MKVFLMLLSLLTILSCGKSKSYAPVKLTNEPAFYDEPNKCNLDSLKKLSLEQNKPILLYFTGWAMVDCRKMEDELLADEEIHKVIHAQFIPQELYMDDKNYRDEYSQLLSTSCMVSNPAEAKFPIFLILDPRDKNDACMDSIQEISTCGFEMEKFRFMKFLEYGLETYDKGPR